MDAVSFESPMRRARTPGIGVEFAFVEYHVKFRGSNLARNGQRLLKFSSFLYVLL